MHGFALLGCGRVARRHAEILSSGSVLGARLVAVCDGNRAAAAAFGKSYDVPAVHDLTSLLAMPSVDVVSILTPSGMHAEHAHHGNTRCS